MNQWYLLQLKPNSHRIAERNLNRQGFKTFLPMQEVTRRKASHFVNDLKPLFPGYIFVSFDSEIDAWRKINSTMGVSRLVSFGSEPKALPTQLVSGLMMRCDENGKLLPPNTLREGDSVEVLTGPFAKFVATVDSIDPEQRIWVIMDYMGQKTRIQIASDQLRLNQ